MPRSARSSAGKRVLRLAQDHSDKLLAEEAACFTSLRRAFQVGEGSGRTTVARRTRQLKGQVSALQRDGVIRSQLQDVMVSTLRAAAVAITKLANTSASMALTSIGEELRICESTLAQRYAGVAEIGVSYADERRQAIIDSALTGADVGLLTVRTDWGQAVIAQLRLSSVHDEDLDAVHRRLWSDTPVRLPGQSGRGSWWQAESGVEVVAREVSIAVSNRVREAAMVGMNAEGDVRDRALGLSRT